MTPSRPRHKGVNSEGNQSASQGGNCQYVVNNAALYDVAGRAKTKKAKEIRNKKFTEFLANPTSLKTIKAQPIKALVVNQPDDFMKLYLKSSKGRVDIEINASELTDVQKKTIRHIFMELTRYIA